MNENKIRLQSIKELIDRTLDSNLPMLVESQKLFKKIAYIASGLEEDQVEIPSVQPPHVIISCDASIKTNPGGPAAVGFVVQDRNKPIFSSGRITPSQTNNQAEYDAVYEALITYTGLVNNPGCEIEIISDSQLVVNQLNKEIKCNDQVLKKKRNMILELVGELPVQVIFQWKPRNSTLELESANYIVQDLLEVPRH